MPYSPCGGYASITAGVRDLRAFGFSTAEIADRLGCTRRQVRGGDDTARRSTREGLKAFGSISGFRFSDLLPTDPGARARAQRAATRRGLALDAMLRRILETVIEESMIDAVLDDDATSVRRDNARRLFVS